jgi:tripartite-type tricarboxylate transporter receptor subunit TctC
MRFDRRTWAMALMAAGAAALLQSAPVSAQTWPSKQMTFIVPFGAGSTPDVMARLIADVMQKRLGQSVVVENRPGAGGNTGTNVVAKAPADGHTFGLAILGPLVVNPLIMASVPYDPIKDLTPISHIASQPGALVVPASSGIRTVEALVEKLKTDGDKLIYGSIGKGSVSHLAFALISSRAGGKATHLPFAGSPPAVTALLRGDVQAAVLPLGAVGEQVKDGKLTLLAVTTPKRSAFFPEAPTLVEKGFAGVEADAWTGLVAPAGLDAGVRDKLANEIRTALADVEVAAKLRAQYIEPVGTTPDAFRAFLQAERDRWGPVIKANDIKAD